MRQQHKFLVISGWLLAAPLLLEFFLQAGSYINQTFFMHKQQTNWLSSNLRIITMGDSNTYGLYLDKQDAYPKQLESIWNTAHPHRPIEVINLGYPGANSSRLVANFEKAVRQFQPDIVLIMIGTNDGWTAPITLTESTSNNVSFHPISWIKIHSRLYRLFCLATRQPFQDDDLTAVTTSDPKQRETAKGRPATINYKNTAFDFSMNFRPVTAQFDVEAEMQKNIERLIQLGKNHHIEVFLLTYAADKGYYKQANKVAIKTAADNDYPYLINTINTFKDLQPSKNNSNPYFFSDLHATAQGNQILANEISKQLASKLGIPVENTSP